MPDTEIAPAPPKPTDPPKPASNGAPKPRMPAGLERTFKDLGRALNQDGELTEEHVAPEAPPPPRARSRSIGEIVTEAREKKTAENGKPKTDDTKNGNQATPPAKTAVSEGSNEAPQTPAPKDEKTKDAPAPAGADSKAVEVVAKPPIEEVVRDTVDRAILKVEERLVKPAPAAATPPPTETAPDAYESTLGEIEKEELALAKFAAEKLPDRYKEHPARLVEFYKKVDAYVSRSKKDDAERTFDDADAEFQKFIADNKPRYQATDRRKLERMQITEEVSQKVAEQTRAETEALRANQHKLEVRPLLEKTVQEFRGELVEKLKVKEDEPEPVKKLRAPIVKTVEDAAVTRMTEYAALEMRATKFDASNPEHVWLLDFIRQQGAYFSQHGGDARIRIDPSGRKLSFMPMQELRALQRTDPAKAEAFWTFGVDDMKNMLAFQADIEAKAMLQQETERRMAEGWEPVKTPPAKKEDTKKKTDDQPPQPTASPKATGSASPGAGVLTPQPQPRSGLGPVELQALGLKLPA